MSGSQRLIDRRGYTFFPTATQLGMVNRELRFKPDVKIEMGPPPKRFNAFQVNPDGSVTVPRAWGIQKIGTAEEVVFPEAATISEVKLIDGFVLDKTRSQDLAASSVAAVAEIPIARGGGVGLISLPCGGGKTVLFIYLIVQVLKKKAAIVVHTNQLADQWEERFRFFCPSIRIGRVQGSVADVVEKDVVICMLQTLSMKDLPPNLFDDVGVMGIDECHLVCTETFSKLLTRWGVPMIFGLSATPIRKDKLEQVLFAHLGGIIYSGNREKVPVKVIFKYPDVSAYQEVINPRTKKPDHVGMITNLVADPKRTKLISSYALEYSRSKVLVLSERRKHLEDIRDEILSQDPHAQIGLYRGQMKPEDLKHSESKAIILGTYSIASVGLDIKGLNTLILATPRSDVVQASGRIQRDLSPLFDKLIIDVYDKFSVFSGQYAKRLQYYRQSEFDLGPVNKRARPNTTENTPSPPPSSLRIDTTWG